MGGCGECDRSRAPGGENLRTHPGRLVDNLGPEDSLPRCPCVEHPTFVAQVTVFGLECGPSRFQKHPNVPAPVVSPSGNSQTTINPSYPNPYSPRHEP